MGVPVNNLELVTEFVSGKLVRYVLNEEDALGQAADLRTITGEFNGTAKVITTYGTTTVTSPDVQVALGEKNTNVTPIAIEREERTA